MLIHDYVIGTIIELPDGIKVKVEQENDTLCSGCLFNTPGTFRCSKDLRLKSVVGLCSSLRRTDHKNVIFKKVETKEE